MKKNSLSKMTKKELIAEVGRLQRKVLEQEKTLSLFNRQGENYRKEISELSLGVVERSNFRAKVHSQKDSRTGDLHAVSVGYILGVLSLRSAPETGLKGIRINGRWFVSDPFHGTYLEIEWSGLDGKGGKS